MDAQHWNSTAIILLWCVIVFGGVYAYREVRAAKELTIKAVTGWSNSMDQLEKSSSALVRCNEAMQDATDAILESLK